MDLVLSYYGDGGTAIQCIKGDHAVTCNGEVYSLGLQEDPTGSVMFWVDIGVVAGLVLVAGIFHFSQLT